MLTTATHNELLQTNNFTLEIHKHNQTFHLPQNQEIFYFLNRKLVLIFEYGLQQESYCLEGMGFLNFYFSTYKWDNSSFRNSFRGFFQCNQAISKTFILYYGTMKHGS